MTIWYLSPMLALAMLLGMAGQTAQGKDGARNFAEAIYARYSRAQGSGPDFLRQDGQDVFSPTLFRLIKRDVEATPQGFAGRLDFDPICSCQDPDGLRVESITVDPAKNQFVPTTVILHYPDSTTKTVRLTLVFTKDGWRVYDVGSATVPSLRNLLSRNP
ncbi:DUF3828 domain-containing protein [Edaphobacter sp. HDX4]|uniref:DUF3828 domain-containing protein n=1 Tax=Edaphobacter sp. HDX4 TaxID=2794064 RepID=UPI002FE6871E